jgi:hypothetical protein
LAFFLSAGHDLPPICRPFVICPFAILFHLVGGMFERQKKPI